MTDVLTALGVMAFAVILGHRIQRKTLFIYPLDIVTLTIALFIVCNLFLFRVVNFHLGTHIPIADIPPLTGYLPFASGYILGYLLSGMHKTTHVNLFNNGTWILDWHIFYQRPNDRAIYLAEQNNKALLKRVLYGIHHEVKTNDNTVFIGREQGYTGKFPWWPRQDTRIIWVLDWSVVAQVEKRFLSPIKWTSEITLAWGSMAEVWEVMQSVDTLRRLNDTIARQQRQIAGYEEQLTTLVSEQIGVILAVMRSGNPINHFLDLHARESKRNDNKDETTESVRDEDEKDV